MQRLTRHGLRLARFTAAYNIAEGAIAITAGLLAGLVSLVGLGLDSGIESVSAVLVGLRLSARLRHGHADERRERRALKLVAVTFFLLAGYVVVEGVRSLVRGATPEHSTVGIVLLAASIVVMPILACAKRRVGERLGGDPLILADAAETRMCVLLSVSTLAGLVLYTAIGSAWFDPVAGFVVAVFAINEGREALARRACRERDRGRGRGRREPGSRPGSTSGRVPMTGHQHGPVSDNTAADGGQRDSRYLGAALVLILVFMAVEVVVGLIASSLALISDAGHMLTDAAAIALALIAGRIADRPANGNLTYGWKRVEILSAQANGNGITLWLLTAWFVYEAV